MENVGKYKYNPCWVNIIYDAVFFPDEITELWTYAVNL